MEVIQVEGGRPFGGEVTVEGAKNSALKLMAATILAPGVSRLTNVPNISDVHVMGKVLKYLGAKVEVKGLHELEIDTSDIDRFETPYHLVAKMRASTAVLGPLLSRFGEAIVAMPGGCNIGARKIDMHILGLEALGVAFEVNHGNIHATTPKGLTGTTVTLDFASVGATENLMMASVRAKGTTTIDNAAREPEIVDLANFLNEMGAKVSGAGSPVIEIEGVSELHPAEHKVVGDRIEAGTFLAMAGLGKTPVTVKGFEPRHLGLVLKKYELMGLKVERGNGECTVSREGAIRPVDIQTLPFPGFPTDMQAQTMALLALCEGSCIVTENVFENRFMLASELQRMGADIRIEGHHAIVHGVDGYSGAQVKSPDLRGGAALVMAGLVADGTTTVSDIYHIDRGYECFVEKLQGLGAAVSRVEVPDQDTL
ncbi:UDP-N-acetylglucosamine 1-carboxyvinyltransferase [Olsenella intestinalis]|uniref:UDP-N-acetylglucosamine 1-carboxyvinyltransferase n=1 Tax=Olsenella intestinalis TaxID=2930083 RepID=UPI00200C2354